MKTIETKTTKSGNVSLKINGERANIKTAARVLSNAMKANNNETVEIVNEAGEKFTYGGHEWKLGYMRDYFNNDNGKSFEVYNIKGGNDAIAESAIRQIANMPEIEKVQAEYAASWERIKKADSEVERQHQAKRKAARDAFDIEWAKYEHARHFAAKIAIESKSVDDNFRLCICSSLQKPVQNALAESNHDDNQNVFDLLPTADELNDVEIDDEAKAATVTEVNAFNVETKITTDNKVTFAHAGKKISLKKAVAQAVETDADYIRIINENGEKILYAMHDDCGWNPETSTNFYWNLKVFADDFARGKIDPKTGERKTEVKSIDFSDEAKTDEPTTTETADKNVDAIGRIISIDVANANNQPVYEAEGRTRGGNFIANYFASAIAAFTWLDKKTGDAVKIERGHVSIARYLKDHGRELVYFADKDLSTIFANDEPEFKKFMSAYGDSVSDINEPYREPKITFEMCRFGTPKTTAEMKAKLAEVEASLQDLQTALEIEVCDDNADNAQVIAEKIVELNARYGHLYEQIYGHTVEIFTDPAQVIAAAIEITAIADEEQRNVFNETVAKIPAAELKAKYDASDDEDERVNIAIEALRNYIEPKIKQQERTIAEQVCASLTADAPQGWAVTFTDKGKYEVTAHGMSTATLDTITAGDFINPKEFFAQFNRTQADVDDEREIALAEARHEREQLLNMRAELAAEFPDEKERLKILDNMIAENSADIDALESLIWKPGMFDAKHLDEDNLPF